MGCLRPVQCIFCRCNNRDRTRTRNSRAAGDYLARNCAGDSTPSTLIADGDCNDRLITTFNALVRVAAVLLLRRGA